MLKIRRPLGRLIFNMGIAIPGKTVFLIETAPRVPCLYHPNNSLTGGYLAPRVGNYHSLVSDTERCPGTIHWLQHSNSSLLGCHYMWSGSQWEPGRPPRCRQWGPMDPMTHLRNTPLMNIHNAAGLAQDCGNPSALAMELLQSCAKSSMSSTE